MSRLVLGVGCGQGRGCCVCLSPPLDQSFLFEFATLVTASMRIPNKIRTCPYSITGSTPTVKAIAI